MSSFICNDQLLDKLFYAALEVKKANKIDDLMNRNIDFPSKEKLKCAIEGIDNLDSAIDVIYEYQQREREKKWLS